MKKKGITTSVMLYIFVAILFFILTVIVTSFYTESVYANNCIVIRTINLEKTNSSNNINKNDTANLTNNSILHHREIRQIKNQYVGKCLKIGQMQEMIRLMTNYYVESGYITTRVYLPEQDLSDGVLRVSVQEGFIEDIEVLGTKKHGNIDFFPANLPLRRRKILNLRDIEQSTDHYNKLKSNNTNISLKPGTKPGGTILYQLQ